MNKNIAIAILVLSSIISCTAQKSATSSAPINTLTRQEQNDGWKLLFNGKTADGWHSYNRDTVTKNWKVADGVIYLDTTRQNGRRIGSGDIVTDNEYENYELSIDWRISEAGNSGIIFNVKEEPQFSNTYNTGPEMQVLDNIKADDNKKENHLAGLLYDITGTAALSKPKPVGEWNLARLIQIKVTSLFILMA